MILDNFTPELSDNEILDYLDKIGHGVEEPYRDIAVGIFKIARRRGINEGYLKGIASRSLPESSWDDSSKETIDFVEWLSREGWYEAADGEYDNSEDPSCVRLSLPELLAQYRNERDKKK